MSLLWFVLGVVAVLGSLWLLRQFPHLYKPEWLCLLMGEIPWARPRNMTTNTNSQTLITTMLVSRHDIAECGLICPLCQTIAAERGDFRRVRRAVVDGQENEVLQCQGMRIVGGGTQTREVPCEAWLVASPTTEHGDHLDDEGKVCTDGSLDRPEFFVFKRITAAQAMREQWGVDVETTDTDLGVMPVAELLPMEERLKLKKHEVLAGEELEYARSKAFAEMAAEEERKKAAASTTPPATAPTEILPVLPDKPA